MENTSPSEESNESLSPLHPASGRDIPADGGDFARWCGCLLPAAGVSVAASGLPHYPGADVLSRCQPGRGCVGYYGTPRTAVRPSARLEADDVHQFGWEFSDYAAICVGTQHRRRATGCYKRPLTPPRPTCRATCPTHPSIARSTL